MFNGRMNIDGGRDIIVKRMCFMDLKVWHPESKCRDEEEKGAGSEREIKKEKMEKWREENQTQGVKESRG